MAARPEVIGDVEQGAPPPGGTDDLGLTPDERAAWDEMQASAKDTPAEEPESEAPPDPAPAVPEPPTPETPVEEEGDDVTAEEVVDVSPDPKTGKTPQKTVQYEKHKRELKKREDKLAAAETELRTERENRVKLAERLAILNEALTAPPPVDPAVAQQQAVAENPFLELDIKVEDDALGKIEQQNRRIAYLLEQTTQKNEETQATLEDRQLKDDFQRDAEMYARTAEGQHFGPAYQFLKDSRLTELAISLFDKDPTDPAQIFTQAEITKLVNDFNAEEKWVVSNARKAGKSPSAAIMKLAKGRGFKPEQPEAARAPLAPVAPLAAAPAAKNGNGAAHAAPGSAVAKIQAEAEGAAAARSLSDGGGAPPALPLTMEKLLNMGKEEFEAYADNFPHVIASMLGKPAQGRA